ncbi:hypothetical protein ACFVZH_22315 [Streptomyces sp. NPDC059534]|uniref:hypothetical protein n=1 Tax=Streptomyces sp. NPDC059534 TaxID=3346859 RepID=UPI0036A9361B
MTDTRCRTCGATASADGAPTTLVALDLDTDWGVYACADHAATLAAPPGDLAVALAQLMDAYRHLYGDFR